MKIVLVVAHAQDHPDIAALSALIVAAGLTVETVDRPPGDIAFLPCIAALDDSGVSRECFNASATVQQIIDAHAADGTPVVVKPPLEWNAYDFKTRFTQAERIAIRNAAKISDELFDFQDMLDTAGMSGVPIVSDNPELLAGMDALVTATIITETRRKQILGITG